MAEVDQVRWDTEELSQYAQRVKRAQTPALMVNYVGDSSLPDDNSFGARTQDARQ